MVVSQDYLVPRQPSVVFAVDFFFFMLLSMRVKRNSYVSHAGGKKRKKKIRLLIGHCLFRVIVACTSMSSDD